MNKPVPEMSLALPYGIVEFEDGFVERVEPTEIIFVD